jgi:hypothetical protein
VRQQCGKRATPLLRDAHLRQQLQGERIHLKDGIGSSLREREADSGDPWRGGYNRGYTTGCTGYDTAHFCHSLGCLCCRDAATGYLLVQLSPLLRSQHGTALGL